MEAIADGLEADPASAPLDPADRAMIDAAIALTRSSRGGGRAAIERLRGVGFDDAAIHQIVQITALFNYYNRLVDGLGVEFEPEWGADPLARRRAGPG